MHVNFTNMKRAYRMDRYPLPKIDKLVYVTAGRAMLSFMDVFSGYP